MKANEKYGKLQHGNHICHLDSSLDIPLQHSEGRSRDDPLLDLWKKRKHERKHKRKIVAHMSTGAVISFSSCFHCSTYCKIYLINIVSNKPWLNSLLNHRMKSNTSEIDQLVVILSARGDGV